MPQQGENLAYRITVLEREVERARERLHRLESTVAALDLTALKQTGAFMDEHRALQKKVDDLATLDEIRSALNQRTITIGQKAWAIALALAVLALSIVNTIHAL